MTWTKVDDRLHSHPKVLGLWQTENGRAALGLHLLAFSYIGAHLTDGVIHRPFIVEKGAIELAGCLVEAGLWDEEGEHWRVHDWRDYNPSRAQVERQRKADAARKRRGRAAAAKRHDRKASR